MDSFLVDNLFLYKYTCFYVINGNYYDACLMNIRILEESFRKLPGHQTYKYFPEMHLDYLLNFSIKIPDFYIELNGSTIVVLFTNRGYMLYQQQSNGLYIELINRIDLKDAFFENFETLLLPLPNGREIDGRFQRILPKHFDEDDTLIDKICDTYFNRKLNNNFYDEILKFLNGEKYHDNYILLRKNTKENQKL